MEINSTNNNRILGNITTSSTTNRQSHKRTFSESDSSSRTERHLCSFSHLWIINYLSSYIDDSNFACLQSECFSPVNTPYSNTHWCLKLYPRGLNEKQHTNNNIAIFLKYVSGTMTTIKAKAEFSVVSRNNELVMLRSTNFHTFSCGNDWGYSEFLDGNYLNSRRNDLLTDDRLRVYVRVILVDEKETATGDLFHPHSSPLIVPPPQQQQQQIPKTQASASSSLASSSSVPSVINSNPSNASSTVSVVQYGLFTDDKERFKSLELLSNQVKTLLDDQRFTDVHIHVIPKQDNNNNSDDYRKLNRSKRNSIKQQPSCSSCHCLTNNEQTSEHHEQSSSVISKDSESNSPSQTRRTTRSTSSLLSRIAQTSSETNHSSSNCSTSSQESSSDTCSSSFIISSNAKRCSCLCHDQETTNIDLQQNHIKYANITPLTTFHAHKAILIARSSSFANQIRSKNPHGTYYQHHLKSPPMNVYIDDLESSTVRAMLIYIYTGRLPTLNDEMHNNLNPIDLFRAAVKYDLHELRDLAKSAMLDVLKIDNAIEMLEVSDQTNDHVLKQQILSFIRSNASAVSKTTSWMNVTKHNPHLIIDAFRSLVTPTIPNHLNHNHHHHHHSTSLTTTNKYPKYD